MKFRKKPIIIEAVQYIDSASQQAIVEWTRGTPTPAFVEMDEGHANAGIR